MAKHPNYELFEEIGRGENSVVFRAWDLLLNRDVAIKQLRMEPGSDAGKSAEDRKTQFLKEASFLAQFEHENILRIHTVDQDRGWIVMELLKGSLATQISTRAMDPDTVRSVLRQILSGLDFLHAKSKVHGSVRPSNILINDQGTVKLSDFEASSSDGELRVPKGSKKYLAPELIRSEFGDFGATVDLYCLGFTALELLTGNKFDSLFPGTGEGAIDADVAWMRWHSSDEAMPHVKTVAPKVPEDLGTVIDQLLSKSVEDRPANAAAVLKLLNDAPIIPVEVVEPIIKTAKKQDPAAILPSSAVKLREAKTTKKSLPGKQATRKKNRGSSKTTAKTQTTLNEFLGRPYVLWPICAAMLIAAIAIGLQLRGNRDVDPTSIADVGDSQKDQPVVEPEVDETPFNVQLNVLPNSVDAKLTVAGEERAFESLTLKPGKHEIVVHKPGFEPFRDFIQIDKENLAFDIRLQKIIELEVDESLPVKLSVFPNSDDVKLTIGGKDRELQSLKLKPGEHEILVSKAGFEPFRKTIRIDEDHLAFDIRLQRIEPEKIVEKGVGDKHENGDKEDVDKRVADKDKGAAEPDPDTSLEKVMPDKPAPIEKVKTGLTLPFSLVASPDSLIDEATGLPLRALVRVLQSSAPMELALVTAGSYPFGVTEGELRTWEKSAEQIEIEQPFYIGVDEVTNAQFLAFAKKKLNATVVARVNAKQANFPVVNISALEAAQFCDWLGGRLPLEKEWEASIRGKKDSGFPLPWSNGSGESNLDADKCKLFRGESDDEKGPAATGSFPNGASSIGLLNTIGNVSEWCDNQHSADEFVIKGCSFMIPPGDHARVTWRSSAKWQGGQDIGLRLLVPVIADEEFESQALRFVAPSNIEAVLVKTDANDSENSQDFTKTVAEIADEFTSPAELVIDSGGFMGEINDISFSPNGKRIAVCGSKVVRIWNVETGALETTLRGDRSRTSYGNANAVAWSPDGKFLLVGVSDYRKHGNIRVYKTDKFDEISEILKGHESPCRELTFSRDGKYLASVDADGLTIVRDWSTRRVLQQIDARDRDKPIYDLMKFPTVGPYLLGVDFEGPRLFSVLNGNQLGAQDEMPARVRGWLVDVFNNLVTFPYNDQSQPRVMDFRLEEGRWAGAGDVVVDGRSKFWIRVWESREPVTSQIPVQELAAYDKHTWRISAIALQPNGSLVASGDKFGEVHVWDALTGERKFKFAGQGTPIYEVAFDKGSTRLAFGTKPFGVDQWGRNSHGKALRVLNLKKRAIEDVETSDGLQLQNEQPEIGTQKVNVRRNDAYYFVERLLGNQVQSRYRISSGRNPTTFTLLDQPKLGIQDPVLFGDNEGLLAMWDSAGDELKRAFIGHSDLVSAISASGNGKLIASSSTDRTIRLWSLENYQPTGIFDFKFENSVVREVVVGTSSERAGVQIGDQIVAVDDKSLTEMFELMLLGKFDYKPGQVVPVTMKRGEESYQYEMIMAQGYDFSEPVLNFYMGDNGQWIIWHPQGYYDASPGADRLIGWHVNRGFDKSSKFFQVQQFRKELYRPDVIDGILETGSLEAALSKLESRQASNEEKPIDFRKRETIAQFHPPRVRITSPENGWGTKGETVTVTGEANSVNELPLTALTLLHNGSVAKVFRPNGVNQLAMKIECEIKLQPGKNDLVLIAANSKSSSQGEHIVVDLESDTKFHRSDVVVLAIGVSQFDEGLVGLPHAASDAKAFVESMKSHENGKLYGKVKTKLLSGEVSENEVVDGFQWLIDNTSTGDVAMVFVASHGIVDRRGNFYIGTSDSIESKARSTAVSWRDLTDTLQLDLPDCKRMVFLDLQPTADSIRPGLRNPLLDLAAPEMGTIFLSSNTLQQDPFSLASSENGAFLRAVMETVGDRKYDNNPSGDSLFNPVELATGVTTRVKYLTGDRQQTVFFSPEYSKFANVLELQD